MQVSMDGQDNFNPIEVHVSMDRQPRYNSIEICVSMDRRKGRVVVIRNKQRHRSPDSWANGSVTIGRIVELGNVFTLKTIAAKLGKVVALAFCVV